MEKRTPQRLTASKAPPSTQRVPADGIQVENEAHVPFNVSDMIGVTARLAQIMAQEVDCLDAMDVKGIEKLQEEKRQLSRSLHVMRRELARKPEVLEKTTDEEKQTFKQVVELFEHVLEENRSRLLVAKELNQCVVMAISDVVHQETRRPGYNFRGAENQPLHLSPSVSLNETI